MSPHQYLIVAVALASFKLWQRGTTHYWNPPNTIQSGFFGKQHAKKLSKIADRQLSPWALPVALTLASSLLVRWWSWEQLDPTHHLRGLVLVLSGIVTWRGVTMDIDLATGERLFPHRLLMIACWVGLWFYPGWQAQGIGTSR